MTNAEARAQEILHNLRNDAMFSVDETGARYICISDNDQHGWFVFGRKLAAISTIVADLDVKPEVETSGDSGECIQATWRLGVRTVLLFTRTHAPDGLAVEVRFVF